jgi:hypothetical protein
MSAGLPLESKQEMLIKLDAAWNDIRGLVDSIPEDETEHPGVVGEWSAKDLLGHMAFWAEKAAGDLVLLREGRAQAIQTPSGEEGIDDWNEREYRRRRDAPLEAVRREWMASFQQARRALLETPEELLTQEVKGWPQAVRYREDTYNHYREHAEHIRGWQRRLETKEG